MDIIKKALIISNIILILAVLAILFFHILPEYRNKTDQTMPLPSVIFGDTSKGGKGMSIAYINTDTVVEHYKYYKELKTRLENEQKMAENQLQLKMKDLEKEYKNLSTKVNLGLIKEEEAQNSFAIKQQEVEAFRTNTSQKLVEKNTKMTEQLYDSIVNYVHRFNKGGRFTYILGYAKGGGIIYAPQSMDISNYILLGLNKEYELKVKGKK
jgi:outer membrane protein